MKNDWKSIRLGEVIVENEKSKFKVRDSISGGKFPFFTSGATISSFDDFICSGENLFVATGGKANVQYYDGEASYSTDCFSLTTRPETSPKFVFYFLHSMLADIDRRMFEGAALRHLQKSKFRDIVIPLPTLSEQQRIVRIIDEAFEGIATAKANAEKNSQNAREVYGSVLESMFSNLGESHTIAMLGNYIEILTDYHANGSYEILKQNVDLRDTDDFAWMVRSTDFENNFQNDKRYITKSAYNFLKKSRVLGGEIIMSKIGNAGKVYLMPEISRPCSLGMNLFLIRLNENEVTNKYAYYYLKTQSGEAQIQSRLKGVATQTITKENIRNLLIPICGHDMQVRIISTLEALAEETQRLESLYQRKLAALEELKKSLLHRAFDGEL